MANIRPQTYNRNGILKRIFNSFEDLDYTMDEESGIVKCREYNLFYADGDYFVTNEQGQIKFKTKSSERVRDWVWNNLLKSAWVNEINIT